MQFDAELVKFSADVSGTAEEDALFGLNYINYYYVDPSKLIKLSEDNLSVYIKQFQASFGLEETGELDFATIRAMKFTPRCGCPDYQMNTGPQASKWGVKKLTYFIESYVGGLSKKDQEDLIQIAFNQWAEHADLEFERVNSQNSARLILSTGRGRFQQFDGPGNTLAWAYLPSGNNYNGQLLMRFDLDETWVSSTKDRGILYLNVACHEFGHMLGLDHSKIKSALMAPYYAPNITKPQSNDDVLRIVRLYGQAKNPPTGTPDRPDDSTPTNPSDPNGYKVEIAVSDLSNIKINGKSPTDFKLI